MARSSLGLVIFGIPWTAFAVFRMVMASKGVSNTKGGATTWLFPLFGLPFLLIGIGMLSSPYWARRRAERMAPVITDRRDHFSRWLARQCQRAVIRAIRFE